MVYRKTVAATTLCLLHLVVDCFVREEALYPARKIPKGADSYNHPTPTYTATGWIRESESTSEAPVSVSAIPSLRLQSRRGMFFGLASCLCLDPCNAANPTTAGESIRSAATKGLPSYYGPTDVFYPASWKGLWNARRIRIDDTIAASFQVRFVASIQDDSVVLDRGFSQASLEKSRGVARTEWVETNPNVLRVDYEDGSWKELKVTKRATERTDSTVSSSEVYRITTQSSGLGVPLIVARRVLTKWKEVDENKVEGIELIYDTNQDAPNLLAKTRIVLER